MQRINLVCGKKDAYIVTVRTRVLFSERPPFRWRKDRIIPGVGNTAHSSSLTSLSKKRTV